MREYGGFWKRVPAYLIDSAVVGLMNGLIVILLFIIGFVIGLTHPTNGTQIVDNFMNKFRGLFYLLSFVMQWLYFSLFESSKLQATPGKLALGMRVTDLKYNRIGFGIATGRYFGKILSGILFCVGYMLAGWSRRKQALHDMMAGALVVNQTYLDAVHSTKAELQA